MDLISGCPFWPLRNGLLATYPALREQEECDVAIIGGGITGALVGYSLAEAGIDAVVVDRRDIGFGSTGASTALLQYETDVPLYRLIKRCGESTAVRVYQLCRDALQRIATIAGGAARQCDFSWTETLCLASRRRDVPGLHEEFLTRRRHGFAVAWWSRSRLAREGSLPQDAGMLSRDAAQLDTFRFTHALMQRGRARGLRVFDRTEVGRWRRRRGGFEMRTGEGFRIRARRLVVAAGYEAQRYVPRKLMRLHSTYALISEPLREFAGWPGRRLLWETARPYTYLRTTADQRAIIGGYDEPFRDPVARDALLPAKRAALVRRFRQWLPRIPMEVAYTWTGTFAETPDSLPYIGAMPGEPHVLYALGYGGNGITFGMVAADIIRDLIIGGGSADAELFRFDRGTC